MTNNKDELIKLLDAMSEYDRAMFTYFLVGYFSREISEAILDHARIFVEVS